MITLRNIGLRRGQNVLFHDVNWTIYHKQHIGIIGANGAGKTSLFAMLLRELEADNGELTFPKQLRLAHVAQETPALAITAIEFVLDGDTELRALEKELLAAEGSSDGTWIAHCHARLSEINAYTAKARAAQLLNGLGFSHEEQQKLVSDFSGGWRVRLNLAKALMCRSDILLLDEPTNHLDLDAVIWLENWLVKYPGTLLLISHDREFLDKVVDHIAHLSHQQIKLYSGNYSAFEKQRAEQLLIQQAAFEKQQKHIAHLQSFINRFGAKATKARQAQSRVKALAKMELINAVPIESSFQFTFKKPKKCPNPLIRLNEASITYHNKNILQDLSLIISPKDRIALLGRNGAGKSSLIKLLAGELTPAAGSRDVSEGLKIGYFAQHQVDQLNLASTPLQHLRDMALDKSDKELRTFLGGFAFVGDRVLEPIKNFSGGEKSRLALALLVWQQPNLLLLDEPTNHLDLDMRQALSFALQEFEGAMIIVSHDRFLLQTTVDQLMLVANHTMLPFDGDLSDYEQWLFNFKKEETLTPTKPMLSKKAQRQEDAKQRELRKPLLQKLKQQEDKLTQLNKEMAGLEVVLLDSTIYQEMNKMKLQKILLRQAEIKKELHQVEHDWLLTSEQLEMK